MASSFTSIQQQHLNKAPQISSSSTTPQQQLQSQSSNLIGRELKLIASSFVKQYYTLLNRAPCFIHNFYNHDSTFIHGTIEMGSDNHTEPVVGREKIGERMKELQLNDCRAKIKQIDCLETLAGGLVLQVIGELSNDGKPMRRFLQTFVLAPSPDSARQECDLQTRPNDNRRGVHISDNSTSSSHNQKFYVLNSIFRYQDDGSENDFEEDNVSIKANSSIENTEVKQTSNDVNNADMKTTTVGQSKVQQQAGNLDPVTPKITPKPSVAIESMPITEQKRAEIRNFNVNGSMNSIKKAETSEKVSTENGRAASEDVKRNVPVTTVEEPSVQPSSVSQTSTITSTTTNVPSTPRQSNEPKTWANMVRNALPTSIANQSGTATRQQPSLNQTSQAQNLPQQQQIPHQHQNQQQTLSTTNEQQPQSNINNSSSNISNNNNSNNRRRHMIRKTSNNKTEKVNGRMIKNRPPRSTTATTPSEKPNA